MLAGGSDAEAPGGPVEHQPDHSDRDCRQIGQDVLFEEHAAEERDLERPGIGMGSSTGAELYLIDAGSTS